MLFPRAVATPDDDGHPLLTPGTSYVGPSQRFLLLENFLACDAGDAGQAG